MMMVMIMKTVVTVFSKTLINNASCNIRDSWQIGPRAQLFISFQDGSALKKWTIKQSLCKNILNISKISKYTPRLIICLKKWTIGPLGPICLEPYQKVFDNRIIVMWDDNDNTQMKIILIVGMGTTLGMAVLALLLGVAVQVFHHYHHHHKLNLYIIVSLSQTYLFTHFRQWHSPAKACKSFFLVIFWFMFGILFFCAAVSYSGEKLCPAWPESCFT